MTDAKELSDEDLDGTAGALSSDPEWRYVPVRRFAATTGAGAFALPEVDDEVVVMAAGGGA